MCGFSIESYPLAILADSLCPRDRKKREAAKREQDRLRQEREHAAFRAELEQREQEERLGTKRLAALSHEERQALGRQMEQLILADNPRMREGIGSDAFRAMVRQLMVRHLGKAQ